MAHIWIVEDDPQIGMLIEMTVRKAGHETTRMPDGMQLEKAIGRDRLPDLLLLDLMLREKNGYVLLKEWKERMTTRAIPVIIISARSTEYDKVRGLELGAEDYITKPFGVRELQARVAAALRRLPREPLRIEIGEITLAPDTRDAYVCGRQIDLTAKEFDVLNVLAKNRMTTVTRGMLLREVWGYETDEDPSRIVDTHIKTLRVKLGDTAGMPRYIKTVRGTGYRLIAGESEGADAGERR